MIIGRLQEYLGTRLEHPEGLWVLDGSDFPKQGKSTGVARSREAGEGGQLPPFGLSARWDGPAGCICRELDLVRRQVCRRYP